MGAGVDTEPLSPEPDDGADGHQDGAMASPTSCMDLHIALDPARAAGEDAGGNCSAMPADPTIPAAQAITRWRVRRRLVYTKLMLAPEVMLATQEAGDDELERLREAGALLTHPYGPILPIFGEATAASLYMYASVLFNQGACRWSRHQHRQRRLLSGWSGRLRRDGGLQARRPRRPRAVWVRTGKGGDRLDDRTGRAASSRVQ